MTEGTGNIPEYMKEAIREGRFEELLFHGTCERFVGALKPGGYDGVCWFAESPRVAQTYIPENGITTYFPRPHDYEFEGWVQPHKGVVAGLLKMMGIEIFDAEYDGLGRCKSFPVVSGHPKWSDLIEFVHSLGYEPRNGLYELKTCFQTIGNTEYEVVRPADYKMPGRLYIADRTDLNLLDMGEAGDLNNPAYNWIERFRWAEEKGYDGITIADYAQSKNYGNVGHISHGVFASAIPKLTVTAIDAVGHDFGDDITDPMTPEFEALQEALSQHCNVALAGCG